MALIDEIKKPFNFITFTLTIISLSLSVVFYYNGRRESNLSYQLNDPVSKIYDSKNSTSSIKLLEKDSILVTQNVYLLTGTIWNSGNLPITKEDVRQNISIKLNSIDRILDYKIIKQFDPAVSMFTFKKLNTKSIAIDWAYFDPNFGFSYQILYVGKEDPGFSLEGKLLGINSFNKVKPTRKGNFWFSIAIILMYFLMIVFLSWTVYTRRKDTWRSSNKILIGLLVACVCIIVYYIIDTFIIPVDPPF